MISTIPSPSPTAACSVIARSVVTSIAADGKRILRKVAMPPGHDFAPRSANSRANPANVAGFDVMVLEDHVRRVAEREPSLRISRAHRI